MAVPTAPPVPDDSDRSRTFSSALNSDVDAKITKLPVSYIEACKQGHTPSSALIAQSRVKAFVDELYLTIAHPVGGLFKASSS